VGMLVDVSHVPDETLGDGVVNVNFYSALPDPPLVEEKSLIKAEVARELPPPPLSRLIDHFHHVAEVAGEDRMGIGSDFGGVGDRRRTAEPPLCRSCRAQAPRRSCASGHGPRPRRLTKIGAQRTKGPTPCRPSAHASFSRPVSLG
jgi:microsomal dipeptidase-like Zn-dependent dipeptidase